MRHISRMAVPYEPRSVPPDAPLSDAEMTRWRWSLRTGVGLMLAALMFIIALILGGVTGQVSVAQLRERIGASLANDAARMADRLNKEMAARSRELLLIGALDPIRTLRDPKEVQGLLEGLHRTVPAYNWIGIADTTGKIVVATDLRMVGTDFVNRAELREPARARTPKDENRPITLMQPVRLGGGSQVGGVVVAQLDWAWIRTVERSQLTRDAQEPSARQLILIGPNDQVLLGPPDLQGTRLAMPTVTRTRAGFFGWTVERFPDGQDYLTGAALAEGEAPPPGPGSDTVKWTVLVRESLETAFAPAGHLRTVILLVGLGLAVVFALLGWLVTGRFTTPLRRIADAADRLRQGEDIELPQFRNDAAEIQTLSASLRALVASLTSKQNELNALETESQHDPLTGLLNRVGLHEWFNRAKARARMQHTGLLVLVGDLDGFKQVNDTLGHPAGDQLLRAVAQRLQHNVRERDAVARLGGDEFVVALDAPRGLNDLDALETARRVWASVVGRYNLDGQVAQIGLSLGGSFWPDDAPEIEKVVEQADTAVYAAKRAGKGRIALYRDLDLPTQHGPGAGVLRPVTNGGGPG